MTTEADVDTEATRPLPLLAPSRASGAPTIRPGPTGTSGPTRTREPVPARALAAAGSAWRGHRAFCVVLGCGAILRFLAFAAYWPALEFSGDSYSYLSDARAMHPGTIRPLGYSAFLRVLSVSPTLAIVPAVQHLTGLGIGIGLYALLVRRGLARGLATAAAAPVLLDAYQIDIEQMVMAETVVSALIVGAVAALLIRARPSALLCGLTGFLLAIATLTRTVALVLGVIALLYLVARGVGGRRLAVFGLAMGVPLIVYAAWFHALYGSWSFEQADGLFLWGRVAPFADCRLISPTPEESLLCPTHPPAERPGPNYYDWNPNSPKTLVPLDAHGNALMRGLADKIILAQPGDYLRTVGGETAHYFAIGRSVGPRDWYLGSWYFPHGTSDPRWHVGLPLRDFRGARVPREPSPVIGGLLRDYQTFAYTPGPVLAGCAGLGVVAVIAGRGLGSGSRRARHDCLFLVGAGVALLVVPSATAVFDYRYLLPTLVLLPPAGAIAVGQLRPALRQTRKRQLRHSRSDTARGDGGWH